MKTKQASTTNTMSCNEFAIGNERTTDTCTIANAFSCHFASLKPPSEPSKTDCALRIFERMKKIRQKHMHQLANLQFKFESVDPQFVEGLLTKLDANSSPGISDIPSKVLKSAAKRLAEPLTELFNHCLKSGNIPNEWKFAVVNPLYKGKGQQDDMNSYRAISILPPVAKIFEKVIQYQVLHYFNSNNLFHKSQHGFREGYSCESAIHELISALKSNIGQKLTNMALFVDFKKAFCFIATLYRIKLVVSFIILSINLFETAVFKPEVKKTK